MSLLTCRHLSVSYDGKAVLSDLNFSVDEGDYLGIIGENGAGKSTLVKALLRLKKISGGEIVTADGFKPTEIGYLPQQTPVQKDFPASVWEVVLSGRLNRCGMYPFYRKSDKEDAAETNPSTAMEPDISLSFASRLNPIAASAEVSPSVSVADTRKIRNTEKMAS